MYIANSSTYSLRIKRFYAVYEQRTRNESQRPRQKWRKLKSGEGWGLKEGNEFSSLPSPSPLFYFLALVSFLVRSKPKIPLLGLLCSETKLKRLLRRLLYLRPPSQNPRFNSHTNSGFLHSRRRPRTLKGFTGELDVSFDLKLS